MTYEEIATEADLDPGTAKRYLAYMRTRWGDPEDESIKCQVGYATEWAMRFKHGSEWAASDSIGQAILGSLDKVRG